MNIEPLKSYLQNKEDIKISLEPFLEKDIFKKLTNTIYIERDYFINDKLFLIKRNTLELEYIGKVYCIDINSLDIKLSDVAARVDEKIIEDPT